MDTAADANFGDVDALGRLRGGNGHSGSRPHIATAHWEFEKVYLSWISQQLEHDDFKLKSSDESSLVLTKSYRGESESVNVQVTPANGKLHVKIAYAIDSD